MYLKTKPKEDTGERHQKEGYVHIFDNGKWKHVCDANWGVTEAAIVCQQLGLQAVLRFEAASDKIDNVICTGKEKRLDDCDHQSWSQGCKKGVHVTCSTINPGSILK